MKKTWKSRYFFSLLLLIAVVQVTGSCSVDYQLDIPEFREINRDIVVLVPARSDIGVIDVILTYGMVGSRNHTVNASLIEGNVKNGLWKGTIPAMSRTGWLNVYSSVYDLSGDSYEEGPYLVEIISPAIANPIYQRDPFSYLLVPLAIALLTLPLTVFILLAFRKSLPQDSSPVSITERHYLSDQERELISDILGNLPADSGVTRKRKK